LFFPFSTLDILVIRHHFVEISFQSDWSVTSSVNEDDIMIQPTIDNDEIDDEEEQIPLPDIQTQYHMSGRVRKRSRLLDRYETSN
jgi:hypothetical protein